MLSLLNLRHGCLLRSKCCAFNPSRRETGSLPTCIEVEQATIYQHGYWSPVRTGDSECVGLSLSLVTESTYAAIFFPLDWFDETNRESGQMFMPAGLTVWIACDNSVPWCNMAMESRFRSKSRTNLCNACVEDEEVVGGWGEETGFTRMSVCSRITSLFLIPPNFQPFTTALHINSMASWLHMLVGRDISVDPKIWKGIDIQSTLPRPYKKLPSSTSFLPWKFLPDIFCLTFSAHWDSPNTFPAYPSWDNLLTSFLLETWSKVLVFLAFKITDWLRFASASFTSLIDYSLHLMKWSIVSAIMLSLLSLLFPRFSFPLFSTHI